MPELPEVETVRRGLVPLIGSRVVDAEVFRTRSVRHQDGGRDGFRQAILGGTITEVARRGKFLWLPLADSPDDAVAGVGRLPAAPWELKPEIRMALLAHLGMSGQLRLPSGVSDDAGSGVGLEPAGETIQTGTEVMAQPHLRVRLLLENEAGEVVPLDFIDQRTFGYLAVVELIPTGDGLPGGTGTDQPLIPNRVSHIGRDILDPYFDFDQAAKHLQTKKSEIKRLLLDQTIVSGIGNIYADEALWQAQVHPGTKAQSLDLTQIADILQAAKTVITSSLQAGGTSFDSLYVNVNGASGAFSNSLAAYGRADKPCPRCGTNIARLRFMNRSSYYCPSCQAAIA